MGCGFVLIIVGIVGILSEVFQWAASNKAIYQFYVLTSAIVGSPYLAAGILIAFGAGLLPLRWGVQELVRGKNPHNTR